jgi:hypothetical protein
MFLLSRTYLTYLSRARISRTCLSYLPLVPVSRTYLSYPNMKNHLLFAALLAASSLSFAQTPIKLSDDKAAPFVAQGSLVSLVTAKNKSTTRVFMQHNAQAKTVTFTEVDFDPKGVAEKIRTFKLPLAKLQGEGATGSSVDEDENDYFGRKISNVTFLCTGINQPCFEKVDFDTANGQAEPQSPDTFFKLYFEKNADAQVFLKRVLGMR